MASQGHDGSVQTTLPSWVIQPIPGGGEGVYDVVPCRHCGEIPKHASYKVIRANDADLAEWYRITQQGKEYGIGYTLWILAAFAVFGLIAGVALVLLKQGHIAWWEMAVVVIVAAMLGIIIVFTSNQRMQEHDASVRGERQGMMTEFLKKFGDMLPDEVTGPGTWGIRGVKYMLMPFGVHDELEYIKWED
jgi:hypothetical protein